MPDKKHHRIMLWAVFFVLAGVVALQLLYPPDRAVPFARVNSQPVGAWSDPDVAGLLTNKFSRSQIRVAPGDEAGAVISLSEAGAELQTSNMVMHLSDYPFLQRLIPFSILWQRPVVETASISFTPQVLEKTSQRLSTQLSHPARNANLAIKDGTLVATDEKAGQRVSKAVIQRAIETAPDYTLGATTVVRVSATILSPATTAADFAEVKAQALAALERPVHLQDDETVVTPTKAERARWLEIGSDSEERPELQLDRSAVERYLSNLNKTLGRPAGTTRISLVNGVETSRKSGTPGTVIDQPAALAAIGPYVVRGEGDATIPLSFTKVAPQIIYNGRYTASEAGLRAYVRDAARDQHANIVVRQITSNGWQAEASGDLSTVSASTYKLYVALYLFDQMNQEKTSWGDPMLGRTVSACFDEMTIASTNECAQKWLSDWGRSRVNNFVYAHGFSRGTTFTHPVATHTTANDLAKFMVGLENGSLIGGAHRDRLLHSLSVHPYRSGIPSGSKGKVYDKVGFLWDYVHDSAIVYHPKGTYVLVVMTKGRSYATIAAITREIEKIMYP